MRAGFEEYFDLSEAEFKELWESATFVFDTNALLSLFRDKKTTSDELLKIISDLSGRIWMPHQVASEFHNNRLGVIIQNKKIYSPIKSAIEAARDTAIESIQKISKDFKHHPVMSGVEAEEYIRKKFDEFLADIEKKEKNSPDREYYSGVFDKLVTFFGGVTGQPFEAERMGKLLAEGKDRCSKKIPPGYIDYDEKKKEDDVRRLGDFIIWKQMLDFSLDNQTSIIFITDDMKEDWWRRVKGETNGPRVELLKEFRDFTGRSFYMYTRYSFLKRAKEFLNVRVSAKTIEDVKVDHPVEIGKASIDAINDVGISETVTDNTSNSADWIRRVIRSRKEVYEMRLKIHEISKDIAETRRKIDYYEAKSGEILDEILNFDDDVPVNEIMKLRTALQAMQNIKEELSKHLNRQMDRVEDLKAKLDIRQS